MEKTEKHLAVSRVYAEISEAMGPVSANGATGADAVFVLSGEFVGFQGHFPEKPILPGICQIQLALALLERWKGCEASLVEITSAKYVLPAFPGDEILCKLSALKDQGDGLNSLKVAITKQGERVAEFRLKARLSPKGA